MSSVFTPRIWRIRTKFATEGSEVPEIQLLTTVSLTPRNRLRSWMEKRLLCIAFFNLAPLFFLSIGTEEKFDTFIFFDTTFSKYSYLNFCNHYTTIALICKGIYDKIRKIQVDKDTVIKNYTDLYYISIRKKTKEKKKNARKDSYGCSCSYIIRNNYI